MGVTEVRGEQHQNGAEPLPPGIDEMPGSLGEQGLLRVRGLGEHLLDTDEPIGNIGREGGIGEFNGDGSDH
jgi:hypothetical protein